MGKYRYFKMQMQQKEKRKKGPRASFDESGLLSTPMPPTILKAK